MGLDSRIWHSLLLSTSLLASFSTSGSTSIYYQDCQDCLRFPSKSNVSLVDVKKILIDEQNNKVIVGARDCLLRLDPTTLNHPSNNDYIQLTPSVSNTQECISIGKSEKVCHNYMQLLLFDTNQRIFACGTNAAKPRCWRFKRTGKLSPIPPEGITGETRSPQYPNQNVTGVFFSCPTRGEYLFTGINTGSGIRSTIYRTMAQDSTPRKHLKTVPSELFLKDANFVSSYTAPDNFTYFFLRETAIEDKSKAIYSRVARVCVYDSGSLWVLQNRFTSFTKSRMVCATPGNVAFNYNQIQSTFKYPGNSDNGIFIYGIFTTPENGLAGSAVCMYSLKAIQNLFSKSNYLEEKSIDPKTSLKAWVTASPSLNLTEPGKPLCSSRLNTLNYRSEVLTFAIKHPLLSDSVNPEGGQPLFVKEGVRFTQIVVDKVQVADGSVIRSIPVMFIATGNGTVYKVFESLKTPKKATVVEQINVIQSQQPIYTMKLYKNALYVGSSSSVTRVPIHHCADYKTCRSCIQAQDPYCGWSNKKCVTKESAGSSPWKQDISHGRYADVCPDELPSCVIKMVQEKPGGTTILECRANGIPVPRVTGWMKDSRILSYGKDYKLQPTGNTDMQRLLISGFGVEHLGVYQCNSTNVAKDSTTCLLSIKGTLPIITSGLTKVSGKTYFWCEARGVPKPIVAIYKVIGGTNRLLKTSNVSINADSGTRAYYCVAQNDFGPAMGRNYTIEDRKIKAELRLTKESWSPTLENILSKEYKTLTGKIEEAVGNVYSNFAAFLGINEITFRKGSVVAEMSLRFAAEPTDKDEVLLGDLEHAVSTGEVGELTVDEKHELYEEKKEKTTRVPATSRPRTTGPPGEYQEGKGIDKGMFAAGILTAIMLSVLLGFALGVKFHNRTVNSCRGSTNTDEAASHKHKNIENLKYIKSPPKDTHNDEFERQQSRRKLLRSKADGEEAKTGGVQDEDDYDLDSDGSTAGNIQAIITQGDETPRKPIKENGKVPQTC